LICFSHAKIRAQFIKFGPIDLGLICGPIHLGSNFGPKYFGSLKLSYSLSFAPSYD